MSRGCNYKLGLSVIGTLALSLSLLTACAKSSSNNNNNPAAAACPNGVCAPSAGIGGPGFAGDGQWQGANISVTNMPVYQAFASQQGLCSPVLNSANYCGTLASIIQLQVMLSTGGCLPGPANFVLSAFGTGTGYYGGWSGGGLVSTPFQATGNAYMAAAGNGFVINYSGTYGVGIYSPGAYNPTQVTPQTLQINTQFADPTYHSTLNVQLLYGGQQFAQGSISGMSSFTPAMAGQMAGYCAAGGAGVYPGGYSGTPGYLGGAGAWQAPGSYYGGGVIMYQQHGVRR